MIIKAVKFVEKGFYAQDFAFGGEGGEVDGSVLYRGSLQNYVIDTGDDVILVDTGLPMPGTEKQRHTWADGSKTTYPH